MARLCFKFSVHSQDDKGQRLRALTDSFLSSPLFCSDSDVIASGYLCVGVVVISCDLE